ncbi:tetratricopeptide repeat protein [bacterium]|nr:tetratricopeptide repeat protein [bacterium]
MHAPVTRVLVLVVALVATAACVNSPKTADDAVRAATPRDNARLQTELISELMSQGQYYAALANIEDVERRNGVTPQSTLLRAHCLRQTESWAAAEASYRTLLGGALAAQAHHGLGLILARRDLASAVQHLQQSVRLQPTNATARNDLGYAQMLTGALDEARLQFETARQLAPQDAKARNNLIVLLHVMGQSDQAAELENSAKLPTALRQQLRRQAAELTEALLAGQRPNSAS